MNYIAYTRVSTDSQGESKLGLESQSHIITNYIKYHDAVLMQTYTEVESGSKDNRKILEQALLHCKVSGATLIVSSLDRLSRRLKLVMLLRESKVKFICADSPNMTELEMDIKTAFAEDELRKVSLRTKNALAAKKRRGEHVGRIENLTGRHLGVIAIKNKAKENPNNMKAKGYIKSLRKEGKTTREIASILNNEGFRTSQGFLFKSSQVSRLLRFV